MKSAYQLGQEARERNTNWDLNPFDPDTYKAEKWDEGWLDKDLDLWDKSGLTGAEWERYKKKTLK